MPHLLKFRKGWQSQNIAQTILYNFAFLSNPITIADDIGIDFHCTFFEKEINKNVSLLPSNSFIIQIKSTGGKKLDISKYIPLFSEMEMPFFIGIVNRKKSTLVVYSGELLPHLFAHNQLNKNELIYLSAGLFEIPQMPQGKHWMNEINWYFELEKSKKYILRFPKVAEFCYIEELDFLNPNIFADPDEQQNLDKFKDICRMYNRNLASYNKHEYLFEDRDIGKGTVFVNENSAMVIQNNINDRLYEMFFTIGLVTIP